MEEESKLQWLIDFLTQQPQHRAPNFRVVENSQGRWQNAAEFLQWRAQYIQSNKLKAYQTRGGGTSLPSAEAFPLTEGIEQVLKFLRSRKSKATNREIKEFLKISDEDWNSLKQIMKQKMILASYRTRGGGVRLLTPESEKTIQHEVSSIRELSDEEEFCKRAEKDWAREVMEFDYVFNIYGELRGSGKWDNPDIFCMNLRTMNYVRTKPCTIYGVETKLEFSRQALLQTYSYLRFCHYAYLVVPLFEDEVLNEEDGLLAEYATTLGVGVVGLAEKAKESASPFVEVIQPRGHIPSLSEVDRFLASHKEKFRKHKLDLDERYFGASLA